TRQSVRSVADAKVVETVQGGGVQADRPAPVRATPRATVRADAPKADSSGTRVVQPGETLRKIATETQYDGVSLEQMLVGLLRKNPEAFAGNNINRLKSGAILGIPEKAEVEAVSPAEAKKVYVAQAADWNAYRQKLATTTAKAPAKEETVSQSSSGKITARVEEKVAPAEQAKDQVKVSRTELAAQGAAASKAAADAEADRIAKDKALKEAQERLVMLEKNVNELQKLVEMKNQKLAELQQQTAAKKDEAKPVEAAKPPVVEPPKVAEAVKPAEPPKPPEEVKPAAVDKPIEAPKPVEPPKPPVKPVAQPVPEPEPEASLFDDPLPLVAGGGILALLVGYLLFKRRRDRYASVETTAAPGPSSLGPNSVFRMTGGQSVDTGNTPPQTGDFSQTGPGTIDTDEVDPVAEADVYMAYGRDTQAEEILLEALQKDPQRLAIHAKLLEIYANRRSLKQFETLASELYAQTGGIGAEWEKVAILGAGLDPENPLYSGAAGRVPAPAFDPDATMIVSPGTAAKSTLAMPGEIAQLAETAVAEEKSETADEFERDTLVIPEPLDTQPERNEPVAAADEMDVMSLDFDLGAPALADEAEIDQPSAVADEPFADTLVISEGGDALDFDLGSDTQAVPVTLPSAVESRVPENLSGDFDLAVDESPLPEESLDDAHDFSLEGTLVMPSGLEHELGALDSTYIGGEAVPEVPAAEPAHEDVAMVDFDLDMDSPATQTVVNPVADLSAAEPVAPVGATEEQKAVDSAHLENPVVNTRVLDADSLEFDVNLTDSVFLGQPMINPEFDIGSINLDLGAEPSAVPAPPVEPAGELPAMAEPAVANDQPVRDAHWEEVNTKLDLAKAYEEMGDLEGARELLQEVLGEGSDDLVDQARAILGRIGE
ncbi:MAG TPA: FimV/HubP family polar landmark protein, partial [Azonexus sp.]|nr:FimV/HubP family polar landmark protein [Azonexus sp.]